MLKPDVLGLEGDHGILLFTFLPDLVQDTAVISELSPLSTSQTSLLSSASPLDSFWTALLLAPGTSVPNNATITQCQATTVSGVAITNGCDVWDSINCLF